MNLADAEIMLMCWGQYMRGNHESLAISGISIIGRCIDEGAGASQSTARVEPHMPRRVELVERCLLEQPKTLVRVCKHKFIGHEANIIIAKKLRISEDICDTIINQAIHNVAEWCIIS